VDLKILSQEFFDQRLGRIEEWTIEAQSQYVNCVRVFLENTCTSIESSTLSRSFALKSVAVWVNQFLPLALSLREKGEAKVAPSRLNDSPSRAFEGSI